MQAKAGPHIVQDQGGALRIAHRAHVMGERDIGQLLRDRITDRLTGVGLPPVVRYIDPSYSIRTRAANAYDSVYCLRLAHAAVHAAMAGRTETVVVRWRRRFVHIPMPLITSHRNRVDPDGDLWMSVLEATGQPDEFVG